MLGAVPTRTRSRGQVCVHGCWALPSVSFRRHAFCSLLLPSEMGQLPVSAPGRRAACLPRQGFLGAPP